MKPFLLLTEGRFGTAVAEHLRARLPGVDVHRLSASAGCLDELVAGARFVGVALWRRYTAACDLLDAACARHGVGWSSAALDGTSLQQGPLVVRGGPCFACYSRRRSSHVGLPDREDALDAAFDADPDLGAEGFLPGTVLMASAGLRMDSEATVSAAGRIRIADLLTYGFEETRVVRVHACPRCAPARAPGMRFTETLVPAFEEMTREARR